MQKYTRNNDIQQLKEFLPDDIVADMAMKDDVAANVARKMTWWSLLAWWHGWLWLVWHLCVEMADDMAGLINFASRVPVAESSVADDYGFFVAVAGGDCGKRHGC